MANEKLKTEIWKWTTSWTSWTRTISPCSKQRLKIWTLMANCKKKEPKSVKMVKSIQKSKYHKEYHRKPQIWCRIQQTSLSKTSWQQTTEDSRRKRKIMHYFKRAISTISHLNPFWTTAIGRALRPSPIELTFLPL